MSYNDHYDRTGYFPDYPAKAASRSAVLDERLTARLDRELGPHADELLRRGAKVLRLVIDQEPCGVRFWRTVMRLDFKDWGNRPDPQIGTEPVDGEL